MVNVDGRCIVNFSAQRLACYVLLLVFFVLLFGLSSPMFQLVLTLSRNHAIMFTLWYYYLTMDGNTGSEDLVVEG